ncbi:hypothetical protein Taro_027990 [Colocasia esculenta]|uniref:Uncharacterized protein n=1 Tax=Colocasia esculenta TaxID=4460 RepID=A0A843VHA1_COLES|nr:hypothetical protein [Colocasia esculenta]
MAPKQLPRRGAKSRASARPNPADDVLPTERRTKRRHDFAEQPGSASAKRGRASSSDQGSMYPRRKTLDSSPEVSEKSTSTSSSSSSSSESSQSSRKPPSKPLSAGKTILKPRVVDLDDSELIDAFPDVLNFFKFQSWQSFISEFRIIYPRLVQEFYQNLECTDEGYKSKVKGIAIDMPTDLAASIFKIPDEGEDYHNFEFNLHEAYTIMTGTIIYYKGSVDTPHDGVDTMFQALSQNMKNWSTSVDTRPGQVDTRGRSQRILFTVWDSRSTPDDLRSTLETSPRELFCQSGTVCRHTSWAGLHTPKSLRLKFGP